jgi:hypothetical protein
MQYTEVCLLRLLCTTVSACMYVRQDAAAKAAALALADSGPRAAGVTLKGKAGVQGVNMDHYNVQTGKVR